MGILKKRYPYNKNFIPWKILPPKDEAIGLSAVHIPLML
jgi:hypothetical protein